MLMHMAHHFLQGVGAGHREDLGMGFLHHIALGAETAGDDDLAVFFQRFTGILSCYALATGAACYDQQRIEGLDNIYASPVAAKDRIYSVSRDGVAVVFRAGETFEVLATNRLEDTFNATPAIVGDEIVLRGDRYLYSLAAE